MSLLALCACPSGISFRANTFEAVSIIHTCPSMFTGIDVAWLWLSYSCLISNNKLGHLALDVQTLDSAPGGTQQMFVRGGSAPRSNFYIPFFTKRYPFRLHFFDKWYPYHTPCLELCIPFNCCKCTVTQSQNRTFSRLYTAINSSVSPFGPFH